MDTARNDMTRKDYVLLEAALASTRPPLSDPVQRSQHARDCRAVADALARENPRHFDRVRFLKECGID